LSGIFGLAIRQRRKINASRLTIFFRKRLLPGMGRINTSFAEEKNHGKN